MTVKPRGREDAPIVIVGDAPTQADFDRGETFSGEVYDLLCTVLTMTDFAVEDCVFVNAVTFGKYVKRGPLTVDEIRPDADATLIPFIARYPRSLVVALGNNALCALGVVAKPAQINAHRLRRCVSPLLKQAGVDALVMASIHPWFVLKEPDLDLGMLCDFRYAGRVLRGGREEQVPLEIRPLDTLESFDQLWEAVRQNPRMAYDYETTDLDRDAAVPVSVAFCNGLKNQRGEFVVWFWGGYDRLRPRFDAETMGGMRLRLLEFLRAAGDAYDLYAWNAAYDDWVSESLAAKRLPQESYAEWAAQGRVRKPLPGSQYDGMIMKWSVDNRRPHGLKESTALFCGYPNYDAYVDETTKAIKARRSRMLVDPDDFAVIEWYGRKPSPGKRGLRWPEGLDKGVAMYAMLPYDELRRYACYDAVYTYLTCMKLGEIIDRDDLGYSCDFRHRVARELLRCEQRGMRCDVELNQRFSTELRDVEERCGLRIRDWLCDHDYDLPDFNPRSGDQLAEVLYGKPVMLPFIDRAPLYRKFGRDNADGWTNAIEDEVYEDVVEMPHVRETLRAGHGVDVGTLREQLASKALRRFHMTVSFYDEPFYLQGMYRPPGFTKTGKPSTTGALLQALYASDQNEFLALVLMARRANKLRGTFVDGIRQKLDGEAILRPRFNPIGTETGRISSSNPNGQNFQKSIRGQLIPRPGYRFLEWDLSQAEVRGIAAESGDPSLIAALDSSDIHTRIASMIFRIPEEQVDRDTHRRYAKTIVFGLIYGMSVWSLSIAIGVSEAEAERFMADFFAAFPVMKQWLDAQVRRAHRFPYYVYTPWGTRRSTRNVLSLDWGTVAHTERIATNMPIQGGAGELCLWYVCEIMDRVRAAGWDAHFVNSTHDSCTLEVAESLAWMEDGEVAGPVADVVRAVIATPPPVSPLNRVSWSADLELNDWWSAEPNLQKALDPRLGKDDSIFRWDLIKPEEEMDVEDVEEFREVEAVMSGGVLKAPQRPV